MRPFEVLSSSDRRKRRRRAKTRAKPFTGGNQAVSPQTPQIQTPQKNYYTRSYNLYIPSQVFIIVGPKQQGGRELYRVGSC